MGREEAMDLIRRAAEWQGEGYQDGRYVEADFLLVPQEIELLEQIHEVLAALGGELR